MEIVGIGTDIVECLRVGRMVEEHGEMFLRRVYTEREIRFCQSRKRATEHLAAHWAAKEAVLRCLGSAYGPGLPRTDIEVRIDREGRPEVLLCGAAKERAQNLSVGDIQLSLAFCRAYATATAVALRRS
jgi:holo-[acyl-carrier protein] synthase